MLADADAPPATIVVPTRGRLGYLLTALESIEPQATAAGAEVLVVDDAGASEPARALCEGLGARYLPHARPLGLNPARNTGVDAGRGELIVFVDDDVEVRPGWLAALLAAAREHPEVDVFTGPIHPRLEGSAPRSCGREPAAITALDLGARDTFTRFAWGANMAIRRTAFDRVGPFDVALANGGDEQEWQERLAKERLAQIPPSADPGHANADPDHNSTDSDHSSDDSDHSSADSDHSSADPDHGGADPDKMTPDRMTLYVAGAALDHRRNVADSRLVPLCRAAFARGRAARRFDARRGQTPSLWRELRTVLGCAGHVLRRRCPAGLTMVAHSTGRMLGAIGTAKTAPSGVVNASSATDGTSAETAFGNTPPSPSPLDTLDDFLSGESGTVGGLDELRRAAIDARDEALQLVRAQPLRLRRAALRSPGTRSVLALCIERPHNSGLADAIASELSRSRHRVELRRGAPGAAGKFENLNRLLAGKNNEKLDPEKLDPEKLDPERLEREGFDWLLVLDDDIALPHAFLDRFLFLAERFELDLAQPAHRAVSHAAWRVTRRRLGVVARETRFVEIGPATAFARRTFSTLLPFPSLRMGWGLDLHWAALAAEHGWRCGVIDAVAIAHREAPAGSSYSREGAVTEAREFLRERPYLRAAEAQLTLATHRRW